jgi:Family of unknown function (DUF6519)
MATGDLSRSATEFRKHYTSVRAQQGRLLVDDDINEQERLHGEDERRSRIDIIGPTGSPDSGFLVSNPQLTGAGIDFDILPGTLYLGGLRLQQEQLETFQLQLDWLQLHGQLPVAPAALGTRFDLVYIEAWQQPVSAVEDSELFEVALGGPDTSTRMRLMHRVHVQSGIGGANCVPAWRSLLRSWVGSGRGTLNADGELVVDTLLKVDFAPGGDPDDLCSPQAVGGYLGADNQAIRVQLVDANHFTWGFDNAAPLYRVQIAQDSSGALKVVSMLTEPKDQAHWPMPGQVVELLPWSAVLSNNEKLAELGGFLATVDAPYDNVTKQFTIAAAPATVFGNDWKHRSDQATLKPPGSPEFFYLRVWNRGSDMVSPPAIPFTQGNQVALGHTGLIITIDGNDRRADDFWIIAARPQSPNEVVPWLLKSGRAPHGVRRYFTPLAVIEWDMRPSPPEFRVVDDCRKPFLPLTRIRSCCTYTVGDGEHSTGQFTRIQDAINALPADGGEVCILPGVYTEAVNVTHRNNITIHGCCERTLVKAPQDSTGNGTAPVFTIADSTHIRIERLAITAFGGQPGVLVPGGSNVANLALEELSVLAGPRSAIEITDGSHVGIVGCDIRMRRISGPWPGIYSGADDVLIKCNTVGIEIPAVPAGGATTSVPAIPAGRGGIQLGGGAERVRVIDNLIQDGMGNGITLGSLVSSQVGLGTGIFFWVVNANDPCDPCLPGNVFFTPGKVPGAPTYHSAGYLYDILIKDNRIYDMGLNGIGVIAFFDLTEADEFITVVGLTILGNDIRRCLRRPLAPVPTAMTDSMGYGGISLADVRRLVIRDNFIVDNGPSYLEPVCGIFVLHVEGADISRNHILNNGAKVIEPPSAAKNGARAGIEIKLALAPTVPVPMPGFFNNKPLPAQSGVPALTMEGNIVSQPLGRALSLVALGPVSVLDNQLTSRGVLPAQRLATLDASTVMILNLGLSNELYLQFFAFAQFGGFWSPQPAVTASKPGLDDLVLGQRLADGNVMFNDNQCVLELIEPGENRLLSSILIISLDDISFVANQCDCNLFGNIIQSQAILLGMSVRATANRFKEGYLNAMLSAMTMSLLMNNTSSNQATHCIYAWAGSSPWLVASPNTILFGPLGTPVARCGEFFSNKGF